MILKRLPMSKQSFQSKRERKEIDRIHSMMDLDQRAVIIRLTFKRRRLLPNRLSHKNSNLFRKRK